MKKTMLILVSVDGNNNKFYYVELLNNGDLIKRWGRVGTKGREVIEKNMGEYAYNNIIKAKKAKGYKETEINIDIKDDKVNVNLLDIAMEQIKAIDKESKDLIKTLVKENIHNITSSTKIEYDIKTGYFSTPLGIVTQKGVEKAKQLLNKIEKLFNNDQYKKSKRKEFQKLNEEYFTIIPTKIKNLREFENLLINKEKIEEQSSICDALISSIKIINSEKEKQKNKTKKVKEQIFDLKIEYLKDKKEIKRVKKYFEESKNKQHGRKTANAKVTKIYKINIGKEEKEYRKDFKNQMELWHGTKIANLLSILKSGLLMPKYSPGEATGYMFGMGLYFSNQSSKSMNYCDGMFWNNSKKRNKIYLFLADIAMGNYKVPNSATSKKPPKGYDSYWAKPNISGILNDEMIIFNNNQIKLKYLLEIEL
jgi:poly [ADP-ribose] polymerase